MLTRREVVIKVTVNTIEVVEVVSATASSEIVVSTVVVVSTPRSIVAVIVVAVAISLHPWCVRIRTILKDEKK